MSENVINLQKKSLKLSESLTQLISEIIANPEKFRDILLIVSIQEKDGVTRSKYVFDQIHGDSEKIIGMLEFTKLCIAHNQINIE